MRWPFIFTFDSRILEEINRKLSDIATTMSKVSTAVEKQNAHLDAIDKAVEGIAADVRWLKELIESIQNGPGDLSAQDQALLDQLEERTGTLQQKVEALDALTPAAEKA